MQQNRFLNTASPDNWREIFSDQTIYSTHNLILLDVLCAQAFPSQMNFKSLMFWDNFLQHLFIPPQSLAECLSNSIKTHWWLKNKVGGDKGNKNKPAEKQRCWGGSGFQGYGRH